MLGRALRHVVGLQAHLERRCGQLQQVQPLAQQHQQMGTVARRLG
jgi:hypothetical protein